MQQMHWFTIKMTLGQIQIEDEIQAGEIPLWPHSGDCTKNMKHDNMYSIGLTIT